jgi:AbrB family looped-hinge helix DNA binding protein
MARNEVARAKVTSKGQVTIPKEVRDSLGVQPGDDIEFVETLQGFRIVKVIPDSPFEKWSGFLEELRGADPDELLEEARGR